MSQKQIQWAVGVLGTLGVLTVIVLHWMVFFWVPTEATMGIVQRIFYIHVPAWWIAFLGFGLVGLCSAVYLWLGDERLDRAAVAAAEAGMVFTTIGLLTGPLWGRVAWGTWWEWEPRLTLALILGSHSLGCSLPGQGSWELRLAVGDGGPCVLGVRNVFQADFRGQSGHPCWGRGLWRSGFRVTDHDVQRDGDPKLDGRGPSAGAHLSSPGSLYSLWDHGDGPAVCWAPLP